MPVDESVVDQQLDALGDFHRFFTSKEIRALPEILSPGETIFGITSGYLDSKTWIIVITDVRLIFLDKGMFYGLRQVDLPLSHINSIAHKTGFFFGEIEVSTASGTRMIGSVTKKEVIKICSIISGLINGSLSATTSTQYDNSTASDLASQLERLAKLYDGGFLNEDEFSTAKQKLLNIEELDAKQY